LGIEYEQDNFFSEPGIPYEVLVMAVNDEGNGPSVREVFYGSQLSELHNKHFKSQCLKLLVVAM